MFDLNISEIVNWSVGSIFVFLTYILTKTWYESKEGDYWLGSLEFLINYAILTYLLSLVSELISVLWLIIVIFLVKYTLFCLISINCLTNINAFYRRLKSLNINKCFLKDLISD